MARVLLVGLALLLPGTAVLASSNPIPGVDIIVKKNPGHDYPITVPTDKNGTYKFTGLAAGNYDLSVGGQRVQTVTVGANQGISGVLSSEPGGKASITFNGLVSIVPDLPSAPVSTSRSNKKAGIAKGEVSPIPTSGGTAADPRNGIGGTGGGRLAFAGADDANSAMGVVLTTRGTAPGPTGGEGTLPGILRVINNSETAKTTIIQSTPVNGIGGQGGGRLMAGGANADSSNRDHIDQDAQTDIKKRTAVQSGGPENARIRISADVSTIRVQNYGIKATETAPGTDGGDGKLPGLASPGTPIVGIPIWLEGDPGSIKVSAKTDGQGAFHFHTLPAGKYKLTLPDLPSQSLIVEADGIAGGTVMRGRDGSMSIFDRWGVRTAASPKGGGSKTAEKPGAFGSGNTLGAGLGGMGPGPMNPATMNPATMSPGGMGGAMAPGGGGAMGPGRAMGGGGMGRP